MKYLSEEERVARNEGLMKNVTAMKSVSSQSDKNTNELSENGLKLLVKAALEPGMPLTEMYECLGLHPAKGKSGLDELLARNMVKIHRWARRGRGSQPHMLEVLSAGKELLMKKGITPTTKRVKRGGFVHDVWARHIEQWAKSKGYRYWFERCLGQKAFDFLYEDENGFLHAIEIYVSGSVEWVASQTIKGAEVEGIQTVTVACSTKSFLEKVMKAIGNIDELGLYRRKIVGRALSEFLP